MTGDAAEGARIANIDSTALRELALKAASGKQLEGNEVDLMGRVDAFVGFHIDAAFEKADQQYRNVARVFAGAIAMLLAISAAYLIGESLWLGAMVGLLSVPVAPLAKDLTSAMTAAVGAVKAVRRGG
jgi:hypothetical protein